MRFLLDENVSGRLRHAIRRHNVGGALPIDVISVGDSPDLPLESADEVILAWAERDGRILVTNDRRTLPTHLAAHLAAGRHSPGIFTIRRGARIGPLVEFLVAAAHASEPHEWEDRITFVE